MLELNISIWLDESSELLVLQFPDKKAKHPHHHLKHMKKKIMFGAVKKLGSWA